MPSGLSSASHSSSATTTSSSTQNTSSWRSPPPSCSESSSTTQSVGPRPSTPGRSRLSQRLTRAPAARGGAAAPRRAWLPSRAHSLPPTRGHHSCADRPISCRERAAPLPESTVLQITLTAEEQRGSHLTCLTAAGVVAGRRRPAGTARGGEPKVVSSADRVAAARCAPPRSYAPLRAAAHRFAKLQDAATNAARAAPSGNGDGSRRPL